jgi:hypothetical protein
VAAKIEEESKSTSNQRYFDSLQRKTPGTRREET